MAFSRIKEVEKNKLVLMFALKDSTVIREKCNFSS